MELINPFLDERGVAFLRAIDAEPDNDRLRLEFADWLEEHGDPRASDIRIRCQQIGRIKEKLIRLKQADSALKHFAANCHRYNMLPTLETKWIRAFERESGVTLPEDYVDFLVRIGEGGAGPSYGLTPLRCALKFYRKEPFPVDQSTPKSLESQDGYDLPDDANYTGCIELADHGCGSYSFLVILGVEAGNVWEFWGANDMLWHPTGKSFLAWYEEWLNSGLRKCELSHRK